MKIKLALTLEITRNRREKEKPETPNVLEHSGSQTEILAQPRYVGFEQLGEEYKHDRK